MNGSVIQVGVRGSKGVLFALKRCKLDHDREYRAAIVREMRIMATGHANLIKLREAAVYKNEVWMVMDLMRCSVFAVLCCRALPEEYAIYIARQVKDKVIPFHGVMIAHSLSCKTLNALVFLHDKGFIHRDVKCENLLIGQNGEVKLGKFSRDPSCLYVKLTQDAAIADFGLATSTRHPNQERLGTAKVRLRTLVFKSLFI